MTRRAILTAMTPLLAVLALVTGIRVPVNWPAAAQTVRAETGPTAASQPRIPSLAAIQALDTSRAEAVTVALREHFLAPNGQLRETYPIRAKLPYAWLWPYSQAMAAALDMAEASSVARGSPEMRALIQPWLRGLAAYWDARRGAYNASTRPPLGLQSEVYYDDNAWVGIDLARAYQLSGDSAALDGAKRVFSLLAGGWAYASPCAGPAGGVYWLTARDRWISWDRTTTSTAGAAVLALRLYLATHESTYLTWGRRLYNWVETYMRDPKDGLYWDHIGIGPGGRCVVDTDKVTYNQGMMIEAAALLARATRGASPARTPRDEVAPAYLDRAGAVTRAALKAFTGHYAHQAPAYNAIFFRSLMVLYGDIPHDTTLRTLITWHIRLYGDWAWSTARDSGTNLFRFPDAEPYLSTSFHWLLDQAAMAGIYATLCVYDTMLSSLVDAAPQYGRGLRAKPQ